MMFLRLYRALPRRLRSKLVGLMPESKRVWLVRRLVPLRPKAPMYDRGGRRVVRDRGQVTPALVSDTATPLSARQNNLDAVVRVLDAAGLPYFRIRPTSELRTAIAVPLEHQERTAELIRGSLDDFTVRWVSPRSKSTQISSGHKALLQVFRPVTPESGTMVLGSRYSCEIEFWLEEEDYLIAPRRNAVGGRVLAKYEPVSADEHVFGRLAGRYSVTTRYRTRDEFAHLSVDIADFPIDAVYTWVDGSDPDWQLRKAAALEAQGVGELSELAANSSRYINRDELRYSLRSLVCFAPWIRHIYLVTDDQIPPWLDVNNPMVTVVRHREIFGDTGTLPTFNSHAIESRLHRIPGLSEHFLYINDDMFFGRIVFPTSFFHPNGIAKFFASPAQLGADPVSIEDAPVNAAAKNNRMIIQSRYGRTITQKMKHVPYALRRSVLEEVDELVRDQVLATAAHQFRHPGDLSIPSSLHHYWALLTGRAVPGTIRYGYADLAHPSTPVRLRELLAKRRCDVFCLNDTDTGETEFGDQMVMMAEFLAAYFPFRAPFELPDDVVAERARFGATRLADELPEVLNSPKATMRSDESRDGVTTYA